MSELRISPLLAAEVRRLELRTRRRVDASLLGAYRSAFRGTGLIFSELREYQSGDDVRHIHWKASVRADKVYVKSFEEDRHLEILLVLDISRSTLWGGPRSRQERAAEFGALIALLARSSGDSIGLCLFANGVTDFIKPKSSRTHAQAVIARILGERDLVPATRLDLALTHIASHQRRRSIIFIVSDFLTPSFDEPLRRLAFRHDCIGVLLTEPPGTLLPSVGLVSLEDAETGSQTTIDSSDPRVRKFIDAQARSHGLTTREIFRQAGADLIEVSDNPLTPLRRLMESRGGRRKQ